MSCTGKSKEEEDGNYIKATVVALYAKDMCRAAPIFPAKMRPVQVVSGEHTG